MLTGLCISVMESATSCSPVRLQRQAPSRGLPCLSLPEMHRDCQPATHTPASTPEAVAMGQYMVDTSFWVICRSCCWQRAPSSALIDVSARPVTKSCRASAQDKRLQRNAPGVPRLQKQTAQPWWHCPQSSFPRAVSLSGLSAVQPAALKPCTAHEHMLWHASCRSCIFLALFAISRPWPAHAYATSMQMASDMLYIYKSGHRA